MKKFTRDDGVTKLLLNFYRPSALPAAQATLWKHLSSLSTVTDLEGEGNRMMY